MAVGHRDGPANRSPSPSSTLTGAITTSGVASSVPISKEPDGASTQPHREGEPATAVDDQWRADPDRANEQRHPVAQAAHLGAAARPDAQGAAHLSGQTEAPLGIGPGDGPPPPARLGLVAEVGQLAKSGAVPRVMHRPRLDARR